MKPIYIHTHCHFFQKSSQKLLAISGGSSVGLWADRNRERRFSFSASLNMRGRCFQNSAGTALGEGMIHLIEGDRTITGPARRMEITQQVASKIVAELTRLGILEIASAGDERNKRIRLSERGWQSVQPRAADSGAD